MSFSILAVSTKWYRTRLRSHPVSTQILTTGGLFIAGDVVSQTFAETKSYDYKRTARLGLYGTAIAGPSIVYWFRFLAAKINFNSKAVTAIARVFIDQCLFAPTFLFTFLTVNGLMQGHSINHIKTHVIETYPKILKANYQLWPGIQLINFYFVPLNYQSLVVNSVAVCWNAYLSHSARE